MQTYIQKIHNDKRGILIFCGFKEQISHLASLDSFEVDMTYKRANEFNEVVFTTFHPSSSKGMLKKKVHVPMALCCWRLAQIFTKYFRVDKELLTT